MDSQSRELDEDALRAHIEEAAERGDHAGAFNLMMQLEYGRVGALLAKADVHLDPVQAEGDTLPDVLSRDLLAIDAEIAKRTDWVPIELRVARLLIDQILVIQLDIEAIANPGQSGGPGLPEMLLRSMAMGDISALSRRVLSGELERFRDAELGAQARASADAQARSLGAIAANARRSWWHDKAIAAFAFYRLTTPQASKQTCYYLAAQLLTDQEVTEAAVKKVILRNQLRVETVEEAVRRLVEASDSVPRSTPEIQNLVNAALETVVG